MPEFDVVGVGLNATDTLLLLPAFPAYGGKVAFDDEVLSPGGQVATAMVTCARLGLRVKYIGTVGDDERGRVQMESLLETGINLDHVQVRKGAPNQSAYILIDRTTGERTVLARRPDVLRLEPDEIRPEQITCARLLHIDGHDTQAVARAARNRARGQHSGDGGHRHDLPRLRQRAADRSITCWRAPNFRWPGPTSAIPLRRWSGFRRSTECTWRA